MVDQAEINYGFCYFVTKRVGEVIINDKPLEIIYSSTEFKVLSADKTEAMKIFLEEFESDMSKEFAEIKEYKLSGCKIVYINKI